MNGNLANRVGVGRLGRISPERVCALWLDKRCVFVAWAGFLLAIISPPHGSGISVCWFQNATGIPCIGCGMTRSLSCAIRGMFEQSWHYHPMGILVLALFLFTATQSVLPVRHREQIRAFIRLRAVAFMAAYVAFVATFVVYGIARGLVHIIGS